MTLKLTHNESVLLNEFADLYAEKRAIQETLTPVQNKLRKLQKKIKVILDEKGKQLPITSIKQRKNIELATTRSQVAWSQLFVEGYYVEDKVRDIVKASTLR